MSPAFRCFMCAPDQVPNIPRTQVTICGAPKAIGIPMTRPINQPQEARPAMARPPATITRMIAMGVSHARIFD